MIPQKNIIQIKDCYGCGVCAAICPHKLIQIKLDKNGFYQPIIRDPLKCTKCGFCVSVCSFLDGDIALEKSKKIEGFAAWSNNEAIRYKSSSGGVGFELGRFSLVQGYKACGVRYSVKKKRAEHFITDSEQEYQESMGSKYVQSYTFDAFSAFKKDEKYFVTGTPCQIDSLRRFIRLKKIEENFVLMDFFCHGVPSMLMWDKYVQLVEKKIEGKIFHVSWRNKQAGWHNSWVMNVNNGKYSSLFNRGDVFYNMFLSDSCLGKACYDSCKYKALTSSADIRIGDLWGKTYGHDEKGVSAVLALTHQGREMIKSLKEYVTFITEDIEVVTEGQMKNPPIRPLMYKIYMWMLRSPLIDLKTEVIVIKTINRYVALLAHPKQTIVKLIKKIQNI
ncbi:MAG: Coenzyme F420 hydrogenase/dehydrogenase, beta subunit C-terminal domain [Desulfobacterales bacterium]|nr:Coenzyme F420 hydrogenase/dehydrogenase, beta subunit C-terminal domain [Desulfobacterales bacterium]